LWFKNHAPSKRRLIQLYAALLTNANLKGYISGNIYSGKVKNACAPGLNCYSCPGASAACPLGALQDSMAQTNTRAPYYIIGILALFGLMLARTICGFLCPMGFAQELVYKIKTPKVKKSRITRVFTYLKYVLLAVFVIAIPIIYQGVPAFCKYICPAGTFEGSVGLLSNGNNADFFSILGYLFNWKFILLILFTVACIFFYRFFCRFFCPLGAIYGFFNKYALIGVKLDESKCIDCGMCIQTCKMDIKHVNDHECIMCGECISSCPTKAISWRGSQIFLKGIDTNSVSAEGQIEETNNLHSLIQKQTTVEEDTAPIEVTPQTEKEQPLPKVLSNGKESAQNALNAPVKDEIVASEQIDVNSKKQPVAPLTKSQRIIRRNFWLKVAAWATALVVLIGALVYYNFLDKDKAVTTYSVGDKVPTFVLSTYKSKATVDEDNNLVIDNFSSADRGDSQVMVINFWYTTCDPCVEEIPYFESVRAEFGDDVVMIVVHAANGTSAEDVQKRIDEPDVGKESWTDYGIIFVQDTEEIDLYHQLGGTNAYPMTVIVGKDGKIGYRQTSTVEEEELRDEIQKLLNA
jgi:ferredoxin/thiol-disulfide isomerase/thioredoxin